jgi:hypothetical protein
MMRPLILSIIAAAATPAFAQQVAPSPPPFTPYTINQEDHTRIMTFLGEQPAKIAIPLMQTLQALEQKARLEKSAADASKEAGGKK